MVATFLTRHSGKTVSGTAERLVVSLNPGKEKTMMRTIAILAVLTILGLLPGTVLAQDVPTELAPESFVKFMAGKGLTDTKAQRAWADLRSRLSKEGDLKQGALKHAVHHVNKPKEWQAVLHALGGTASVFEVSLLRKEIQELSKKIERLIGRFDEHGHPKPPK